MQRALLLSFVANVALQPFLIHAVVVVNQKKEPVDYGTTTTLLIQGASMLEIGQVSEVKPPKGVKTVIHIKAKNGGYRKGSPLYKKQEGIDGKKKGKQKNTEVEVHDLAKEASSIMKDGLFVGKWHFWPDIYSSLASVSVYAVLVLVAAFLHKRHMVSGPLGAGAKVEDTGLALPTWTKCGFAFSLCDCGNFVADLPICLTALCCPIVQWASTASRSPNPFLSYWKAVAILLAMVVLVPFTYGLSALVAAFLFVRRRTSLRKSYNHSHPETRSMFEDVGLVFCCPSFLCCQLVQEAREVEHTNQTRPMQSASAAADIQTGQNNDHLAHVKAMTSVKDFHGKASTHAMRSTTLSYFHEEGQAPDSTEAQDAHMAFLSTTGGLLCFSAIAFSIVGYFAILYSAEVGPGTCPYPLATFLYYYGYLVIGMALIMLCTIVLPPCYACNLPLHAGCQCVGVVLAVMTLLSYSQAHQCGASLWWASLVFSSPLIALCVFMCCSPFGAAKATAFVGYKAAVAAVTHAPSYKAAATVATHGSAV